MVAFTRQFRPLHAYEGASNILGALQDSIWRIFHSEMLMPDMFAPLLKSGRHVKRCISSYFDLKTYITKYRGYADHSRRAVHAPVDV